MKIKIFNNWKIVGTIIFLILFYGHDGFSQEVTKVIKCERIFDGIDIKENITVVVKGNKIDQVGSNGNIKIPENALLYDLEGHTLLPGLIEGHSHVLLHPYNETSWNDQVLKESIAERSIRASVHARKTLEAGFTTIRDLGSEGAGYADVGVRQSIKKGIIPGPRMIVSGPAIVTTGSYGPKGFAEQVKVPLGAHEADGIDDLMKEVRRQIGGGADFIKVYADYRWGPYGKAAPTFTLSELELIVEIASSSGRQVVAHAASAEGMRRAVLAGVSTIEHGDGGTKEIFELMKEHNVALCPTLAAGDAIMQYGGWEKGSEPAPQRIVDKKKSFKSALEAGVTIVAGGDVGVFPHGDNVRELEMMKAYGMDALSVLRSVTSVNARIFEMGDKIGRIKPGMLADFVIVEGDPSMNLNDLRKVKMVVKDGEIVFEK